MLPVEASRTVPLEAPEGSPLEAEHGPGSGVEVPLPELFDSRTVANLAVHVLAAQAARVDPAELEAMMAGLDGKDALE